MVSNLGLPSQSPRVIWTDLLFRLRHDEGRFRDTLSHPDQTKVMETCLQSLDVRSKQHPMREKHHLDRRTRKAKPPVGLQDAQEDTDQAKVESDALKVATEEPPSMPGKGSVEEKQVVKKIFVDLRPLLENIMDSSNEGQEELCEKENPDGGSPSSDLGEPPEENATQEEESTEWTPLCLMDSGLQKDHMLPPRTEGQSSERTTLSALGGGPHKDFLLPPKSKEECPERTPSLVTDGGLHKDMLLAPNMELLEASALHQKNTMIPRKISLDLGKGPAPQTSPRPAVPILELKPRSPVSFPRIIPLQQNLPEADGVTNRPAAFSFPDIEVPTQLLLRRLEETTTSQNHLLIAQVMRYVREELWPSDDPSFIEGNHLPELPNYKPSKTRKGDGKLKEENSILATAKKPPGKFTWQCNRSAAMAEPKSPPDLLNSCRMTIKEPCRIREKAHCALLRSQPDASRKIPNRTLRVPSILCSPSLAFGTPR